MKTIHNKSGQRILHGESITALATLEKRGEQFDAMLTDPPYASGGLHVGAKSASTTTKYQTTGVKKTFPSFGGDARSQLSWVTWMAIWLNGARRILVPGAPVMMFCDWRQIGAAVQAIQIGGFTYRGMVVWDKRNARPQPGRFRAQCEYVVFASNGPMPRRDVYLPGVFTCTTPPKSIRRHATQKPIPLLVDLLAIVPEGGSVLDPFAGSGTTLHACRELKLRGTAIEESAEIASDAAQWLREA